MDEAIEALHKAGKVYPLTLRRLKKRKLMLRGQMTKLTDEIDPDIIASTVARESLACSSGSTVSAPRSFIPPRSC